MNLELEKLMLDAPNLEDHWNYAYGVTVTRRNALSNEDERDGSFFNDGSETATTLFFLGRLDGWSQASLWTDDESWLPRNRQSSWNKEFFQRLVNYNSTSSKRTGQLGEFLGEKLGFSEETRGCSFLVFEIEVHNDALNCGKTIQNPSFLKVERRWSQYDALLVFPIAEILVFIEAKVNSKKAHGTKDYPDVPQPVRNVEAAFFITKLKESKYKDWDFRYMLICPKSENGAGSEIEKFFGNGKEGHGQVLRQYTEKYLDKKDPAVLRDQLGLYLEDWKNLQDELDEKLLVVTWDDLLAELKATHDFDPKSYFHKIANIPVLGDKLCEATKERWRAANLPKIL